MLALAPVVGLAVCVATHIGLCRYMPTYTRLAAIALAVVGGGGFVVGVALGADHAGSLPVWLLIYLLLAYGYVIGVFNLGESSRRIRLLIELYQAPGGAMTLDEILVRYNARMVVEARLGRLVAAGQLIERDGRYWIGNRMGLHIARLLAWVTPLVIQGRR